MKNCLVTKLSASADNPTLPVFETMEQFTLDAIVASGNNNMTDAQKVALNHFFYEIGAIDNDGIYSKLDFLYLPLICNQNVSKAFVDYKGSYTKESSSFVNTPVFSGNGLTSSDTSKKKVFSLSINRSLTKYSAAIG